MRTGWPRLIHYNPGARLFRRFRKALATREDDTWVYEVLAAQIREYRPDVIVNQSPHLDPAVFLEATPRPRLLVVQIASPLPPVDRLLPYDLAISSLPNLVEQLRSHGLNSQLHQLGFEPEILSDLGPREPAIEASFVGQASSVHSARSCWLTALVEKSPLELWGPTRQYLGGALGARWRGEAWGLEMYRVLRQSQVTVNHHIDIAANYANNLRLYEATGVGTPLVTDQKDNLSGLFSPDEVVAYQGADDCVEKVNYLLVHPDEAEAIGRRGQARTLRDHTWARRMAELKGLLERFLAPRRGAP